MKRLITIAGTALAVAGMASILLFQRSTPAAYGATVGTGPTISIGTPSLVSGKLEVPVNASGSGFVAYASWNVHLRWTPGVFTFSTASAAGGVIDPADGNLCPAPNTAKYDSDGGGVVYSCLILGGSTTNTGLMATFKLTPGASGCTALHLFSFGAPDGGTTSSGTVTLNPSTGTAQANTYGADANVNVAGQSCDPNAEPTLTPTATSTAVATDTPGPTNTPMPTGTPKTLMTVTPSVTPTGSATAAPASGTPTSVPASGGTPVGVVPPGTSNVAGVARVPKSGTGAGTTVFGSGLSATVVMLVLSLTGIAAVVYASRQRTKA